MSDPLPPELFGVPGDENQWLDPQQEQATLARVDAMATICDDTRWLIELARKLLTARIATRNAVCKMRTDLAAYEQGQGILGQTAKP